MSEILYHYTSLNTFNEIIKSSEDDSIELRATHIEYLNDLSEYKIAITTLLEMLIAHESSLDGEELKGFSKLSDIKSLDPIVMQWREMPPFISAFSEDSDSLPMWNTYANKSLGIAIGFDRKKLSDQLKKENINLIKCIYDVEKVKNQLNENIKEFYNSFRMVSDEGVGLYMGQKSPIYDSIRMLSSITKDSSFSYENEWRAILKKKYDDPNLKFYANNEFLKMYHSFNIFKSSIKEIIIGPCLDFELVKKSIFMLLKQKNFDPDFFKSTDPNKVNIKRSNCPYRNI
jgi:hypothetical protein